MRTTATALIALILASLLAACNTVKGAGQDIQKGGQAIENAATK